MSYDLNDAQPQMAPIGISPAVPPPPPTATHWIVATAGGQGRQKFPT